MWGTRVVSHLLICQLVRVRHRSRADTGRPFRCDREWVAPLDPCSQRVASVRSCRNMNEKVPSSRELMLPVLSAVARSGSASRRQIRDEVEAAVDPDGSWEDLVYESGDSHLAVRIAWATNFCWHGGLLDRPERNLYLLSEEGARVVAMPAGETANSLDEAHRIASNHYAAQSASKKAGPPPQGEELPGGGDPDENWRRTLLAELHNMSPEGFERYVLHLLQTYGMVLDHVGGPADGGVDGFGTAPMGDVLSVPVAVQIKRYDPTSSIGRERVALLRHDAAAKGAERAVLVTLGTFSRPAKRAAREATPTVDLIDGERLCDLIVDKGESVGVRAEIVYRVTSGFLRRFEP